MKRTNAAIIGKVILFIIIAFLAFEIFGAVFNIVSGNMQNSTALSVVAANSGDEYASKAFVESNPNNKKVYNQSVIVIYTDNIGVIKENIEDKFKDTPHEVIELDWIYDKRYDPQNIYMYEPDYRLYQDKMDLRPNDKRKNFYIIGIWHEATFSHNHINYYIDQFMDKKAAEEKAES